MVIRGTGLPKYQLSLISSLRKQLKNLKIQRRIMLHQKILIGFPPHRHLHLTHHRGDKVKSRRSLAPHPPRKENYQKMNWSKNEFSYSENYKRTHNLVIYCKNLNVLQCVIENEILLGRTY